MTVEGGGVEEKRMEEMQRRARANTHRASRR